MKYKFSETIKMRNVLITATIFSSIFISLTSAACNKAELSKAGSAFSKMATDGKAACGLPENQWIAQNKMSGPQIDYITNKMFPAMITSFAGDFPMPEGYDAKKIQTLATEMVGKCKDKMIGYNPCSGDPKPIVDCMKPLAMPIAAENADYFAENCNTILKKVQSPDFQNRAKVVMEEQIKNFPKN